jgi:hypothetical protein
MVPHHKRATHGHRIVTLASVIYLLSNNFIATYTIIIRTCLYDIFTHMDVSMYIPQLVASTCTEKRLWHIFFLHWQSYIVFNLMINNRRRKNKHSSRGLSTDRYLIEISRSTGYS